MKIFYLNVAKYLLFALLCFTFFLSHTTAQTTIRPNISVSPDLIKPGVPTLTVTLTYNDTPMKPTPVPTIQFVSNGNPVSNIDQTLNLTMAQGAWADNETYVINYPVIQSSQQNFSDIISINATGGSPVETAKIIGSTTGGEFRIQMNQALVTEMKFDANNGGSNIKQGTTSFTISVTYDSDMNQNAANIPTISFNPAGALPSPTGSWVNNRTLAFNYIISGSETNHPSVTATVTGGKTTTDIPAGNGTGNFIIDFIQPEISNFGTTGNISPTTSTYTITLTYNEEMSADAPAITITPSAAAIFNFQSGSWDVSKKIYTAHYNISKPATPVNTTATITASGAKDLAGNTQVPKDATLNIDQRTISATASMTPQVIQNTTETAKLILVFNMDMNQTIAPKVVLNPEEQGRVLDATNIGWVDNRTYVLDYIVDKSTKKIVNDIDVIISEAKNTNGETMASQTIADVFSIDLMSPSCITTFSPDVVLDETSQLIIILAYDTEMNTAINPKITFGNFLDVELTFVSPSYSWSSDKKTCTITYNVVDQDAQVASVIIIASEGQSTTGNVQINNRAANNLVVDMLDFVVTPVVNSNSIDCNNPELIINIKFNQPMTTTTENFVSFPDYEPNGFITFKSIEWSSNAQEATIIYDVHANIKALNTGVDIEISSVNNFLGRAYPGGTFTDVFSVKSNPPIIGDVTAQSPKCHNEENGEIHIPATNGTLPYTYDWSKNGTTYPKATGADATQLGAGLYYVKVSGSDNCWAETTSELSNPDAIVLTAEVIHHVEKRSDGEVLLTVAGGTPQYTFYMNGNNEGEKSDYPNLAIGTYNFEVVDNNSCRAEANAEVKDYQTPTIFTPNGDGLNDIFMMDRKVEIYDREGTLIYKGDDGWNGYYKGQLARPAVYFYIVTFPDGTQKKGTIQLFKK